MWWFKNQPPFLIATTSNKINTRANNNSLIPIILPPPFLDSASLIYFYFKDCLLNARETTAPLRNYGILKRKNTSLTNNSVAFFENFPKKVKKFQKIKKLDQII